MIFKICRKSAKAQRKKDRQRMFYYFAPLRLCGRIILVVGCLAGLGCSNGGHVPSVNVVPPGSGIDMVLIPAGSFEMGSKRGLGDEKPMHKVWIDSFFMD